MDPSRSYIPESAGAAGGSAAFGVRLRVERADYGGQDLFRDLDVEFPAGTVTCLLGRSGVGKSTLLALMAGLPQVQARFEAECSDGRALAGRVAWMGQRDLLLPWLTVAENVALGARLRGEPVERARVDSLLGAVGLESWAQAPPATLSSGMRQRVALARTLYERSPVVLMDEPFSALDALTRHRLQALAVRLLQGRTVVLVTHDPAEAVRMGHRIAVLEGCPARLGPALHAPGAPPRDPASDACLPLLRELLGRLGFDQSERAP